ncbi:FYVE, RhoGEF and PH domain-containing protein 5b isoform X1 [Gadus morhua]|uniref:FYVE, RhoGEF and PH domain-containing protein 5b isoform X1 n=1 Tax=Gadus morhua TaxID=8049 RepID=UPI0011B77875|nr:FYVE, RhoGEF and PH domain-containing protein 5-like isoform X1 [Gadus morhua]
MNTGNAKPPVAPKPALRGAAGFGLASPLLPRAGSSTAKGPKPAVAPKPRVRQDRDPREAECCPDQKTCPNGGPRAPDRGSGSQHWAGARGEVRAKPDPHVQDLLSEVMDLRERDPGNASPAPDAGGESAERAPEDDTMQGGGEGWRSTDASALRDVRGSPDSPGASHAGLVAGPAASVEMIDTDTTEDLTSEGCDAGEALADTDGFSLGDCSFSVGDCSFELGDGSFELGDGSFELGDGSYSVGDCSFASVDEEELALSSVRGPRPRDKEPLEDGREDSEVRCTADPLKVRAAQDVRPANGDGAKYIANVLSVECSHGSIQGAGSMGSAQNQNRVLLEVQTKPEPNYISSEDVIDARQILIDHKVALLSRSPVIQHKHLLGDSSVALPRKYRCITDKDSPFSSCRNNEPIESSEDPLDVDDGVEEDKDEERRHNRMNVKSDDHKTWLMNAALDCRPQYRLVSFSVPPDPDTSLTSSVSEGQLTSPQALYGVRDEDTGGRHAVPFLDDTTDTEQDLSEEHVYEETGPDLGEGPPLERRSVGPGPPPFSRPRLLDPAAPALTSSPMLGPVRARCYPRPPGLSLYPRSVSVEGQELTLRRCQERDAASREPGDDGLFLSHAFGSSGSFSRCPPRPISGLATPTSLLDIPPPFELACITKRPLTKSSPSLHTDGENNKKKSSIKRFLMLKFRKKSSDRKPAADLPSPSSRSSSESINHLTGRSLEAERNALSHFSLVNVCSSGSPRSAARLLPPLASYGEGQRDRRSLAFLSRSVIRVESFEERSRGPLVALALTKPRSISFPSADSASDYENVPPLSSDYENVSVPHPPPLGPETFPEFFERPWRARSTAHDTDGYVDMSSFPGFERRTRAPPEETESAYTEAYKVCSMAVGPPAGLEGLGGAEGPDPGQTSEDEDRGADGNYDRPPDGRSRAFYIAKELMDTERLHVKALKQLQEDFREAVCSAVGADGERVLGDERLREILTDLPDVYSLHRRILGELEDRLRHWEESQSIADVILSKKADFFVFTTFIGHYDRSVSLLEDSCRSSPAFAALVSQFEQSVACEGVSLKHQLLRVIVRVAQYRMLLTDYLNNLRPDSKEYEDSQAAVAVVSDIADQANDSLQNGENVLRLVNIEYSVRGQKDLLRPGRVFIKEGTLMKVSRKSSQPRHLFLMNDVLLYTYPQQDGKYRLKDTLSLSGMKVTKPSSEETHNGLKIEVQDVSISLSASSSSERDDWFYTLSRTVADHSRGAPASTAGHGEDEDYPGGALGERPPRPVCASQVLMCMNCTCDFSLRLRRHHCHACGRIVCRSCSRNRCALKYLKGRTAKVCDHCYSQLHARGAPGSASSAPTSPRTGRSRPLSAVFQNIHPPNLWRHRKGTASFTPGAVWEEGAISGSLQRSKRSKQHWKRLWFLLKDKVLYTYRAQEEKVASESLPLLGFTVKLADREQLDEANLFQLYHKKTLYYSFRAEDNCTAQRWVNAMEEATVL